MADSLFRVYEAVNHTEEEALVSFSAEDLGAIRTDLKKFPPRKLQHWKPSHKIAFRLVTPALPLDQAVSAAREHSRGVSRRKLRTFLLV